MTTLTAPAPAVTETRQPLTALDRCDRCGAQAYLALEMPGKTFVTGAAGLLFCAHHSKEHETAALSQGFVVAIDERHKLAPTNRQQGASY